MLSGPRKQQLISEKLLALSGRWMAPLPFGFRSFHLSPTHSVSVIRSKTSLGSSYSFLSLFCLLLPWRQKGGASFEIAI